MKVGLVRHFRVMDSSKTNWMNSSDFDNWVQYYNRCDVVYQEHPEKQLAWNVCYSSDLSRAVKTAESLYGGEIIKTDLLREIDVGAIVHTNLKFHRSIWLAAGRMGWLFNHPTQESRRDTLSRAKKIIDLIEAGHYGNILLVSHGAFMTVLRNELIARGYQGDRLIKPVNGKVYFFEKG